MLDILLPALTLANNILTDETLDRFGGILDSLVSVSTSASDLQMRLEHLNNDIAVLVEEDRNPTEIEWARWAKRSSDAHNAIQDA